MRLLLTALLIALPLVGQGSLRGRAPAADDTQTRQSLHVLRASALAGNAHAQHELGLRYENGDGVQKNYTEALSWFFKSAKQGIPESQYAIGHYYSLGYGVTKDLLEAERWFLLAAKNGSREAQQALGLVYQLGKGVPINQREAVKWYLLAAGQGSDVSQFNLAQLYTAGEGVTQNYSEAAKWYRKAAEQGMPEAQYNLAAAYSLGQGVPTDIVESYVWFSLAASNGNRSAQGPRDEIAKTLDSATLKKAQARAKSIFEGGLKPHGEPLILIPIQNKKIPQFTVNLAVGILLFFVFVFSLLYRKSRRPINDNYTYANKPWPRLWAYWLDWQLFGMFGAIFVATMFSIGVNYKIINSINYHQYFFIIINWTIVPICISVSLALFGTTPGKIIFQIHVVQFNKTHPTISMSIARTYSTLLHGIYLGLPIIYLIGANRFLKNLENNKKPNWDCDQTIPIQYKPDKDRYSQMLVSFIFGIACLVTSKYLGDLILKGAN